MRKQKILNIFLASIVLLFAFGCYENKGSDTYTKLNEIAIARIYDYRGEEGNADSVHNVITNYNDTLKITPTISMTLGGEVIDSNYDYSWELAVGKNPKGIEVSKERNLVMPINIPIGGYRVYFFMIEKSTKIRYYTSYPLVVNNLYSKGLLVLTENEQNYPELDMVSYLPTDTISFRDILATSNVPQYKYPTGIFKGIRNNDFDEIHIMSKEGTYYVNQKDFTFRPNIDEVKYKMTAPTTFWDKGVVSSIVDPTGRRRLAMIDGNAYSADNFNEMLYGFPINLYRDSLIPFKCAPIMSTSYKITNTSGYNAVFYDITLKRFAQSTSGSEARLLPNTTADILKFDWRTGLDFVTSFHSFFGPQGEITTILTDNNGAYYAYRYGIPKTGNAIKSGRYDISDAVDIDKAKVFFASSKQPYIFYGTGNKIHGYDLANGKKYCFNIDMGGEVTAVYDAPTYASEKGTDVVYIATYGGTPGSGKISKFSISDDPNKVEIKPFIHGGVKEGSVIVGGEPVVWTGFNKIIDMCFK